MNTTYPKFILLLFFILVVCNLVIAQEEKPKDELYLLHEDIIKIDKVSQYEETVKKELELWKKHGMETTVKYASKSDDNHYYYLTPLNSYADLDKLDIYWENFSKKVGKEKMKEHYKNYEGTYVSHKNVIMKRSVELSYLPANYEMKPGDTKFLHFDRYYFKEGKMSDGIKLMKEFKELMTNKNSQEPYNVWYSDIGNNIGQVIVVRGNKNSVEYYQTANKRMETVKEELKELWPKFSKTLKSFSHNNGKPLPDFKYSPGK